MKPETGQNTQGAKLTHTPFTQRKEQRETVATDTQGERQESRLNVLEVENPDPNIWKKAPAARGSRMADVVAQKSLSGKRTKKMKNGDREGGDSERSTQLCL